MSIKYKYNIEINVDGNTEIGYGNRFLSDFREFQTAGKI